MWHLSNRRLSTILTFCVVSSAVLAFTPLRLISFVLLLFTLACLLPLAKMGSATRLVVAFVVLASFNGFLAAIFWLVQKPLGSGVILCFYALSFGGCLFFIKKKGLRLNPPSLNISEVVALLAALSTALILIWPLFFAHPTGPKLAQLVMAGGDNAAHIEMVKTNDLNKGIAYGFTRNRVNPSPGTSNYPQTWHFNVAFTKWLVEPLLSNKQEPTRILQIYYFTTVLWFALLMFAVVRLSLFIGQSIVGSTHWVAQLGPLVIAVPFFLHWLISLFTNGFQAQNASLLVIVVEALLLILAWQRPPKARFGLLLLATVCAVSTNFIWVFMIPLAFLPLGVAILLNWRQNNWRLPLYYLAGSFFLGLLSLMQPLLYKLYPVAFDFPWILQRGLVNQTSMFTIVFIMIVLSTFLYVCWKNVALRITGLFLTTAFGFSVWLFNYQISKLGELRYFYFKSCYSFFIFAAIMLGALACCAIHEIVTKNKGRLKSLVLASVICVLTGMVGWATRLPETNTYADSSLGGILPGQASEIITQLADDPSHGLVLGFMGACNRGDDIRAGQLAHALAFVKTPQGSPAAPFDSGPLDEKKLFRNIEYVAMHSTHQLVVVSSDQALSQKLITYLGPKATNKIQLINLDSTIETEPVAQCPDRSREVSPSPPN